MSDYALNMILNWIRLFLISMEILVWKNDQFWTTNDHNRRSDLTYDYALNMIFDWIRFFLISMEILVWKNDQFWTTNDHNRRSDLSPIGPTYEHIRRIIVQSFLLGFLYLYHPKKLLRKLSMVTSGWLLRKIYSGGNALSICA